MSAGDSLLRFSEEGDLLIEHEGMSIRLPIETAYNMHLFLLNQEMQMQQFLEDRINFSKVEALLASALGQTPILT